MTGRFESFNWKDRLESLFPDPADPGFIEHVRQNFKNHRDRNFSGGRDSEFAWFFQVAKNVNPRLRERPLFVRWLILCVARPWNRGEFLLSWNWQAKDFEKGLDYLAEAGIFEASDISEKAFRRLKDDGLLRMMIAAICAWGRENFNLYWRYRLDKGRLSDLLRSQKTMTRRELQRQLRIKQGRLVPLLDDLKKNGLIQEQPLPRNSVQVIWSGALESA